MKRRSFIKTALVASATGAAVTGGLLSSNSVFAASHAADITKAKSFDEVLKMMGATDAAESDMIKIKAPDIAENGAVVPITVSSTLENVESISILAPSNPFPMTSTYELSAMSEPYVSTRIKLGKTTNIVAVVKSDGKLYSATKEVKVTIGGCGG